MQLRSKHKSKDGSQYGVDVIRNTINDMNKLGVLEPLKVKEQIIESASEAAEIIMRIDDIISSRAKSPAGGPRGMEGGMGGED